MQTNTLAEHPTIRKSKRSIVNLLAPLDELSKSSINLSDNREVQFTHGAETYEIPQYTFIGSLGGDTPIHIGIFAGIHGDESEGIHAVIRVIRLLESHPELARGYHLSFYPLLNPTGYEDNTRHSRQGKDLNREFWLQSEAPEVRLIEEILETRKFQGIISLHTDDTSDGFYGYARGATLTAHLIKPALRAAAEFLPINEQPIIDGFPASNGVIKDAFSGILAAPRRRPRPFEIILESPATPTTFLKELALVAALQTILVEYRKFISYAKDI